MTPGHPVARLREAPSASSARALSLACGSWGHLREPSLLPNPGEATHNAPLGATLTTSAPPLPQLQCPCQLCTPSSSACAQLNARRQHPQNAGRCPKPRHITRAGAQSMALGKAASPHQGSLLGEQELLLPPGGVHAAQALGRVA